jgi:hypothetical protein
LSGKNSETFNLKRAANKIRRDEKDALIKAESDARLAVDKAVTTRELDLTLARENEISTLRNMERQFENTIKAIREANRNRFDEIKKTRADAVAEARNKENLTVKKIYDEESSAIRGADKKNIQRIKYDTLRNVRQARLDTERAINEALFEEKHAIRKALDIANRDIDREAESQNRARIRTIVDAKDAHLKASRDADLQYRRTVDEIARSYRQNVADIKKQAGEDIIKLKNGSWLPEKAVIPPAAAVEEKQETGVETALEDQRLQEAEGQPAPDKTVSDTETITPESTDVEAAQDAEETPATQTERIESVESFPTEEYFLSGEQEIPEEPGKAEDIDIQPEIEEQPVPDKPFTDAEIINPESTDMEAAPDIEETPAIQTKSTESIGSFPSEEYFPAGEQEIPEEPGKAEDIYMQPEIEEPLQPEAEVPAQLEYMEPLQQEFEEPVQRETKIPADIAEPNEVISNEEQELAVVSEENAVPAPVTMSAAAIAELKKSGAALYSGIVKIVVKSPVETYRIKSFSDELNKIDKVRMLFIGGEANKDTMISIKLDEEIPLFDILKTMPDIDGVSLKNKLIQVTLKTGK